MSLTTLTSVDVPIPTDKLGSTFKDILSPVNNPWFSSVMTFVLILSTFAVTSFRTLSNLYLPRKDSPIDETLVTSVIETSGVSIVVLIPIWLMSLLTANTVSGKAKLFFPTSALICKISTETPVGVENLIFWFVLLIFIIFNRYHRHTFLNRCIFSDPWYF